MLGTCPVWRSFYQNVLQPPVDNLVFTSAAASFGFKTSNNIVNISLAVTCSDSTKLKYLVSNLISGNAYDAYCDGNTWRTFSCGGNRVFCINCKRNCGGVISCPSNSYNINSCGSICEIAANAYSILNIQYSLAPVYPVFLNNTVLSPTISSVKVSTNVSKAGNIYCAAFLSNLYPQTVMDIKRVGVHQVSRSTAFEGVYSAQLYITSLFASTNYTIYCYTEDFSNHIMPLQDVLAASVQTVTSCCRQIVPISTTSSFVQYQRAQFIFGLNSQPLNNKPVTLAFQINKIACTGSTSVNPGSFDTAVSPINATLTSLSSNLLITVSVTGTTTGCYSLSARSTIVSTFYIPANVSFSLQSFRSGPNYPVMTKCYFSDEGSSLWMLFDSPTDLGASRVPNFNSQFDCSLIVSFPGSEYSLCRWTSLTTLQAIIGGFGSPPASSIKPNVNDSCTLLLDKVSSNCPQDSDCSTYAKKYSISPTLKIQNAINPMVPAVLLSAPASINYCEDLVLDLTAVYGHGGRPWSSVQWSASNSVGPASDISNFLNENFNLSSVVTIPNSLISPSSTYTIVLTVINFLQQYAMSSVTVHVNAEGDIVPIVRLFENPFLIYRWQPLSVFGDVQISTCSPMSQSLDISYEWKLYNGYQYVSTIHSSINDPRYFTLKPFTLQSSSFYFLQLTAFNGNTSALGTTVLQVGRSALVASISGGSSRKIGITDTIPLDASASVDLDYPTNSLTYVWSCSQVSENYGKLCAGFQPSKTSKLSLFGATIGTGEFTINVTVTNTEKMTATTSIQLSVINKVLPFVATTAPSTVFNINDRIVLSGSVSGSISDTVSASWSCYGCALNNFQILTPTSISLQAGQYPFQLALIGNTLTGGLSFTFQLQASYKGTPTLRSSSTITITINAPPFGGVVSASPTTGIALTTLFAVATSSWSDAISQLPLSYAFSYYTISYSNSIILQSAAASSSIFTVLGQGNPSDFTINIVATAVDTIGGAANTSTTVSVTPPSNLPSVISETEKSISTLVRTNPISAFASIGGIFASVNLVDCSGASSCSSLNRQQCADVSQTCGDCVTGYVGLDGAQNLQCQLPSGFNTTGGVCMSNSGCISGVCSQGQCQDTQKKCPNSCSDKGSCTYVDETGQQLPFCSISNSICSANCECQSGYFGKDCSLSNTQYASKTADREFSCVSIYAAVNTLNPTSEAIVSLSNTITSIFVDPAQITKNAAGNCSAALLQVVQISGSVACTSTTNAAILRAFSALLQASQSLSNTMYSAITVKITTLTIQCLNSLGIGEKKVQILRSDGLRLLTVKLGASSQNNQSFSSPRTSAETLLNSAPVRVDFNLSSFLTGGSLGVSMILFGSSQTATASAAVQLAFSTPPLSSRRRTLEAQRMVEVSLPNSALVQYPSTVPQTIKLFCISISAKQDYYVTGICASGSQIRLLCSANIRGEYIVYCPVNGLRPQCIHWTGSSFQVDPFCKVSGFSSSSTTCMCNMQSNETKFLSSKTIRFTTAETHFFTPYTPLESSSDSGTVTVACIVLLVVLFAGEMGVYYFGREGKSIKKKLEKKDIVDAATKSGNVEQEGSGRSIYHFYLELVPNSLHPINWRTAFKQNLLYNHDWLRILSIYYSWDGVDRFLLAMQWMLLLAKLLSFLFLHTIFAYEFYSDVNSCIRFVDSSDCNRQRMLGLMPTCSWNPDNKSCAFLRPNIDALSVLVLAIIVLFIFVPYNSFLNLAHKKLIEIWKLRYRRSQRVNIAVKTIATTASTSLHKGASILENDEHVFSEEDEFLSFQTLQKTLMLGARLSKLQSTMDASTVSQEAMTLYHLLQSYKTVRSLPTIHSELQHISAPAIVEDFNSSSLYYPRYEHMSIFQWNKVVQTARSRGESFIQQLNLFDSDTRKEILLLQSFLVDLAPPSHQSVLRELLHGYNQGKGVNPSQRKTRVGKILSDIKTVILVSFFIAHFVLLSYYTILFGSKINSLSIDMWAVCLGASVFGWFAAVEIITILLHHVLLVNAIIAPAFNLRLADLHERTRLALMRTCGLLRHANAVVQHLNPACRAARAFPHLPVSRLLLSISDGDISSRLATAVVRDHWEYVHVHEKKMSAIIVFESVLLWVFSYGTLVGTLLCDLFATSLTASVAVAMYYFFFYQKFVAALFVAALVFVCIIVDTWLQYGDAAMKPLRRAAHLATGGAKREKKAAAYEEFYVEEKQDNINTDGDMVEAENSQLWLGNVPFGRSANPSLVLPAPLPSTLSAREKELSVAGADMNFADLIEAKVSNKAVGGLDWTTSGADFLEAVSRPKPRLKPTPAPPQSVSSAAPTLSWGVSKNKSPLSNSNPNFEPGASILTANSQQSHTDDSYDYEERHGSMNRVAVEPQGSTEKEDMKVSQDQQQQPAGKLWKGPTGQMKAMGKVRRQRELGPGPGPGKAPEPSPSSTQLLTADIALNIEQQSPSKAATAAAAAAAAALEAAPAKMPGPLPLFDLLGVVEDNANGLSMHSRPRRERDEQPHPMQRPPRNDTEGAVEGSGNVVDSGAQPSRRRNQQAARVRGRSRGGTRPPPTSTAAAEGGTPLPAAGEGSGDNVKASPARLPAPDPSIRPGSELDLDTDPEP